MEKLTGFVIDEELLGVKKEDMVRISLAGCEVVRRQFMSHNRDSLLTVRADGIQFNNACIKKMVGVEYIYILIDREKKRLMITACNEDDRDGQKWCNVRDGQRRSRKLRGRPFCDRLFDLMSWCKGYSYRICGSPALAQDDEDRLLMVFELDDAEAIPLTERQRKSAGVEPDELTEEEVAELDRIELERMEAKEDGRKATYARLGTSFPELWEKSSFGVDARDHEARVKVPTWKDMKDPEPADLFSGLGKKDRGQGSTSV